MFISTIIISSNPIIKIIHSTIMIGFEETRKTFMDWAHPSDKIELSDLFGFYGAETVIPRRSSLGWITIKYGVIDILRKYDVEHCLCYGSLTGFARFGHEEPYMDDWDVAVPNDKENVLKLEKALEEIKNNNKGHRLVDYAELGFQFFAFLDHLGHGDGLGFPSIGQIDFFYMHKTEDGKIKYPKNASGQKWLNRWEGDSFNKIFPAKLLTVNNDTLYLPQIADSPEFFNWLSAGYNITNISIWCHFKGAKRLHFPSGTYHKNVLKCFFELEDIGKANIENKVKSLNVKEWPTFEKENDSLMPINRKLYMKLLPHILSCVDFKSTDENCIIPSTHLFFISDIVLYRPNISFTIEGVIPNQYSYYSIFLDRHKNGLPTRQQMLDSDITIKTPFNSLYEQRISQENLATKDDRLKKNDSESIGTKLNNNMPFSCGNINYQSMKLL